MKKVISILLACLMIGGCVPVIALAGNFAADDVYSSNATIAEAYTTDSAGSAEVSGTYTMTGGLTVSAGFTLVVTGNLTMTSDIVNNGTIEVNGGSISINGNARLTNNGTITINKKSSKEGSIIIGSTGSNPETGDVGFVNIGTLTVKSGGHFIVLSGSVASNKGKVSGISDKEIQGKLMHLVTLPAPHTESYAQGITYNRMGIDVNYSFKYMRDSEMLTDTDYAKASNYSSATTDTSTTLWVEQGDKLYVYVEATSDTDSCKFVNTARMQLTTGGVVATASTTTDSARGIFVFAPKNALDVTVVSYRYQDIVKLYSITLPTNDGYYVSSKDGDVDEATVEYGKTFSFHVTLNPDYDKSTYTVYWGDLALEPDQYGYYDITGPLTKKSTGEKVSDEELAQKTGYYSSENYALATTGGVQQSFDIRVVGIVSNQAQNTMNSVLSMIQQIIDVIKEIFQYFKDIFTGVDVGNIGDIFNNI